MESLALLGLVGLLIFFVSRHSSRKSHWRPTPREKRQPSIRHTKPDRLTATGRPGSTATRPLRSRPEPARAPTLSEPATPTQPLRRRYETLSGRAWVVDGDTIIIDKTRIRLWGIDAPEMDHPFGKTSKFALIALTKGQIVTATFHGSGSFERAVAHCRLPDGRDLAAELVKQGLALDWPHYSNGHYARWEPDGVRRKLWRAHARMTRQARAAG